MTYDKDNIKQEEEKKKLQYFDMKDYQSKFLLSPDIEGTTDYSHLDKNLAITNLRHNPRINLDEPQESRSILRALHILNNPKHYHEEEEEELLGYKEQKTVKGIIMTPVFQKRKVLKPNYPRSFHNIKSEFISLINVAAARGGHRIKAATTQHLIKEETLQDKTENKNKWFNKQNKNNNNNSY